MIYDCIVIGMGISGISSAIYLKNGGLNILMLEKEAPGGLLNKINKINNYPGYAETTGPELSYKVFESVESLEIPYKIEEVVDISIADNLKIVKTNKDTYKTKYIVIASGRNPRKLNIENEKELTGKGVSTCAICDGSLYKGQDIAIVGGGNSALEEAIYLSKLVNKIYLIHRRDTFRAEQSLVNKVKKQANIEILYNSNVTKINSTNDVLESIEVNNERTIEVKGLFVYVGFESNTGYLKNLNITNESGNILVNAEGETQVDGIYAVGDAIQKDLYQLVTGASEGAIAAVNIIKDINQKENA